MMKYGGKKFGVCIEEVFFFLDLFGKFIDIFFFVFLNIIIVRMLIGRVMRLFCILMIICVKFSLSGLSWKEFGFFLFLLFL